MSARPLVPSAPLSEFGDLPTSSEFNDPHLMDRDQSYVPGFSEMRRNRDIKVGEYMADPTAERRLAIPTLPVNLRWARNQSKGGTPDSSKPYAHGRKGYRVVTKESVNEPWLTELPPGAQIGPDGSIRNGDCILMVADAKDAARSDAAKQRQTNERIRGIEHSFAQNARTAGANPAAQPTVEMGPVPTPESGAKPGRK